MMPGETSPTPAKDSMGMDMVPVYEKTAQPEAHSTAQSASQPASVHGLSPAAVALLKPLAFASADAAAFLAGDDLAGYKKQLPVLRAALAAFLAAKDQVAQDGPLAKFKGGLADPADLEKARHDFARLSTAVADLARENDLQASEHLHIFECPMAGARWLQRAPGLKNPFLGALMSGCGKELSNSTVKLDPQALNEMPRPGSSGVSCGSCGTSKEKMAACDSPNA